jgi:hypothetical protein
MTFKHRTYDPRLLESWHEKKLQFKWRRKYGHIFDDDDLRIALSQPNGHFGEWFVAISFAEQGYNVLVEKYLYKNHARKKAVIERFFTPDRLELLKQLLTYPCWHQPPDLFIYKGKQFFFVEVKRDRDSLGETQRRCFEGLEKRFPCKVRIYEVKAKA